MTAAPNHARIALPSVSSEEFADCAFATGQTAEAPACAAKIAVGPVLERWRREAIQGVCDTGRYRMRFAVWGQGPPLVVIPGMCDDRTSFLLPASRLSARYCCISYDHPAGRGDGARLSMRKHADYVDDFFRLLDHLKIERAIPLGSSFGSTIALAALHRAPERLPRGILQGGFARRRLAWAERMLARWARWWPGTLGQLPGRNAILFRGQGHTFDGLPPERWEWFLERNGAPPIAAVAQRALTIDGIDLRSILPQIRQPVLMICGDRDWLVRGAQERELLEGLAHPTRAEIEGAGHMPQYTHPEVVAELVEQWLGQT